MGCTSKQQQSDLRTSTGTENSCIHSVHEPAEFVDMYQTTTGDAYNWKYTTRTDTDAVPKPVLCTRQDNIRNIDEKMRLNPWLPLVFDESEYSSQYVQKEAVPMLDIERAPGSISICKSRGLGRDEQPPVPPGPNSFAKHLDPFISTTHLSYVRFTDAQVHGIARNDVITMYSADVSPEISLRREPVYDKMVFKKQNVVRVLPRVSCIVPHKGMKSEAKAQYVHPYNHALSSKTWDSGTEFPVTIPRASLLHPQMYCTENCHLGTG